MIDIARKAAITYRHKKRGTCYLLVGKARLQCSTPIADNDTMIVYEDTDTGEWSVRKVEEFNDGRFEEVPG